MLRFAVQNEDEMKRFGLRIGSVLHGYECLELVGDVGVGKTTFVKGLARAMSIDDDVQSPSFTLSRVYENDSGVELHHYDFYRLADPGVLSYDLTESLNDPRTVTVIEWSDTVQNILPDDRMVIKFEYRPTGQVRDVYITAPDVVEQAVKESVDQ